MPSNTRFLRVLLAAIAAFAIGFMRTAFATDPPSLIPESPTANVRVQSEDLDSDLLAGESFSNFLDVTSNALSNSSDPHDWTLAAMLLTETSAPEYPYSPQRTAISGRAATALPDDALAQLVAFRLGLKSDRENALKELQRLEPDNAFVWLETLNRTVNDGDKYAIDLALKRMATSTRVDDHVIDMTRRLVKMLELHPLPPEYVTWQIKHSDTLSAEASSYQFAFTLAANIDANYRELIEDCRNNGSTGAHAQRSSDCASIGRLLARHGPDAIANLAGFKLLRISRTFTDDDMLLARNLDWLVDQESSVAKDKKSQDVWFITIKDRCENGDSGIEAMRRVVARAGKPLEPPADWIDKNSPFSAQHLQSDKDQLSKSAHAH